MTSSTKVSDNCGITPPESSLFLLRASRPDFDRSDAVPAVRLPALDCQTDGRLPGSAGEQANLHPMPSGPDSSRDEDRGVVHRALGMPTNII